MKSNRSQSKFFKNKKTMHSEIPPKEIEYTEYFVSDFKNFEEEALLD